MPWYEYKSLTNAAIEYDANRIAQPIHKQRAAKVTNVYNFIYVLFFLIGLHVGDRRVSTPSGSVPAERTSRFLFFETFHNFS